MGDVIEVLKGLGLDPSAYGAAIVLGVLLRFGRGMVHWITAEVAYGVTVMVAAITAVVMVVQNHANIGVAAMFAGSVAAATLVTQRVLQSMAEKVSWLPKDNEWAPKKADNGAGNGSGTGTS